MTIRSTQALLRNLICTVLLSVGALLVCAPIEAQKLRLNLRISITDGDNKRPVENVEIQIPRQGANSDGATLSEVHATIRKGEIVKDKTSSDFLMDRGVLVRPSTDFELNQTPHKLIVLKAEGYAPLPSKELSNDLLTAAFSREDKTLEIPVELTRTPGTPLVGGAVDNQNGNNTANATPGSTQEKGSGGVTFATVSGWITQSLGRFNYVFWILGFLGFCFVSLWILLVLLARVFQRGSIERERRTLRFAPLLAQGLVRPFGYRLKFSLLHKRERRTNTEADPPEVCLRSINDSLLRLFERNSATGHQANLRNISDNLIRLVGPNPATGIEGYINGISASLEQLSRRNAPADGAMPNYDSLRRAVKEVVDESLKGYKLVSGDLTPESGSGVADTLPTESLKDSAQTRGDSTSLQRAKTLYQRLLDHQLLDCKPFYLETDAKSSILGKLKDDNVYLLQVSSSQATFVLFVDDSNETVGWVFPNTAPGFDRSTLKDVFPGLNEAQFNDAKEQIEPVVVRKVDERRWKVDRDLGFL